MGVRDTSTMRGGTRRWLVLVIAAVACACRMDRTPSPTPDSDSAAPSVRIGGIDWYVDYEAALGIAREQDKALWVHFGEDPG